MKKSLIAIAMALLTLGMVSCNKDEEETDINNPSGYVIQPVPVADGIYTPMMKIAQILGNKMNESWTWSGNKLSAIQEDYIQYTFSYEGNRISQVGISGNGSYGDLVDMNTNYTYNGTYLTQMANVINDETISTMTFQHNADNKISHIDMDVDTNHISDFFDNLFGESIPFLANKNSRKLGFGDHSISADLNWTGNNMTQFIIDASVDVIVTVGEIQELLNTIGSENFGQYAEIVDIISVLNPDRELPLIVGVSDTIDYTYDDKNNPYYGFLYYKMSSRDRSLQGLSQNNVLTYQSYGVISASFQLEIIPGLPLETYSFPLPMIPMNQSYIYQYNAQGFPISVTDKKGTFTITYTE